MRQKKGKPVLRPLSTDRAIQFCKKVKAEGCTTREWMEVLAATTRRLPQVPRTPRPGQVLWGGTGSCQLSVQVPGTPEHLPAATQTHVWLPLQFYLRGT